MYEKSIIPEVDFNFKEDYCKFVFLLCYVLIVDYYAKCLCRRVFLMFQNCRKITGCGYLFVAPDSFNFSNNIDRTKVSVKNMILKFIVSVF